MMVYPQGAGMYKTCRPCVSELWFWRREKETACVSKGRCRIRCQIVHVIGSQRGAIKQNRDVFVCRDIYFVHSAM